jgi:anti-sigma factor RsiW
MSDQDTLPAHVHPESALLPWYVNGTLNESERLQIDHHLAGCSTCRAELENLTGLKSALNALYAAQPGPSSHTSRNVRENVAREALARHPEPGGQRSLLDTVDEWFRSLFVPRWIPTLAATLLIAQIGLIMWISMPMPHPEQITTRSLGMQQARIVVAFQNTATDEHIRGLLQSIHGRITDGPAADGRYTIEVPAADASAVQHKLNLLRERQDIVRSADPRSP